MYLGTTTAYISSVLGMFPRILDEGNMLQETVFCPP